jgi:ribosome-associated protein
VQAIADEIDHRLSAIGVQPKHTEGYTQADWLLMDYVDFVVHIFSESARKFYGLERLWKTATRIELADLEKPARKPAAAKTSKRATVAAKSTKTPAKSAARKRAPAKRTRKSSGP